MFSMFLALSTEGLSAGVAEGSASVGGVEGATVDIQIPRFHLMLEKEEQEEFSQMSLLVSLSEQKQKEFGIQMK